MQLSQEDQKAIELLRKMNAPQIWWRTNLFTFAWLIFTAFSIVTTVKTPNLTTAIILPLYVIPSVFLVNSAIVSDLSNPLI